MLCIFIGSAFVINAQVNTIHNPDAKVTITPEQVAGMGKAGRVKYPGAAILNFEGLGNLDEILQFYNGGTSKAGYSGPDFGIRFSPGAMAIINAGDGGSGNFTKDPLPNTALFFLSGEGITINIDSGFTTAFSFYFSASANGIVTIYSGSDATGNILSSKLLQSFDQDTGYIHDNHYDTWKLFKVTFQDTARSLVIRSNANYCAFDDMVFGNVSGRKSNGTVNGASGEKSGFISALTTPVSTTEKGKLFLTGASRFGISVGSEKSESGGSTVEGSEITYFNLDLLPKAGYYFIDNLVGGIFIDLEFYNNKPNDDSGYGYKKGTTFVTGPFARYYIPFSDKVIPFAEAQVGFGIDNYSDKESSASDWEKSKKSVFTYRVGAGATYFINSVVGLDGFMGFLHDSYKYKDSGEDSNGSDSKSIYNEFTMQLGIVVILDL